MDRNSLLRPGLRRRLVDAPTPSPTSISPGGIAAAVIFTLLGVGAIIFLILLCVYQKEYQKEQARKRGLEQQRKLQLKQQQKEDEERELERKHLAEQKMLEEKESQESSTIAIMALRIQELENFHFGQSPPPAPSVAVAGQFNRPRVGGAMTPRHYISSPTIDAFYAPNDTFDGDKTIGIRSSRPADPPSVPSVSLPTMRKSNHGSPSERSNPNGGVYDGGASGGSTVKRDLGYDTRYHPSMEVQSSSYLTQQQQQQQQQQRALQTPDSIASHPPSGLGPTSSYSTNYTSYPSPSYQPAGPGPSTLTPTELSRQQRHRHYQTGYYQTGVSAPNTLLDDNNNNNIHHHPGDAAVTGSGIRERLEGRLVDMHATTRGQGQGQGQGQGLGHPTTTTYPSYPSNPPYSDPLTPPPHNNHPTRQYAPPPSGSLPAGVNHPNALSTSLPSSSSSQYPNDHHLRHSYAPPPAPSTATAGSTTTTMSTAAAATLLPPLQPPSTAHTVYLPPPYSPPPSPPAPPSGRAVYGSPLDGHNNDEIPGEDSNVLLFPDNIPPKIVMPPPPTIVDVAVPGPGPFPGSVPAPISSGRSGEATNNKNNSNNHTNSSNNASSSSSRDQLPPPPPPQRYAAPPQPQRPPQTIPVPAPAPGSGGGSGSGSSSSSGSGNGSGSGSGPGSGNVSLSGSVSGSGSGSVSGSEQSSVAARVAALKAHNEAIKRQKLIEQVSGSIVQYSIIYYSMKREAEWNPMAVLFLINLNQFKSVLKCSAFIDARISPFIHYSFINACHLSMQFAHQSMSFLFIHPLSFVIHRSTCASPCSSNSYRPLRLLPRSVPSSLAITLATTLATPLPSHRHAPTATATTTTTTATTTTSATTTTPTATTTTTSPRWVVL